MNRVFGGRLHIAIIMDGNGRWAMARNLPREAGHRKGADSVRAVIEAAPAAGATVLTLYAFSSDNWKRPRREVSALMRLLRSYLLRETRRCARDGVRVTFIGRRDRLSPALIDMIEQAEIETAHGERLHLRIALDYSSRDQMLAAIERLGDGRAVTREAFAFALKGSVPDVDLLVRTGG
ncbi:MAG: polyprenyl diphosphate synthase, partial [Acidobacteria bacterium]|nr:polyprenyl diphosphate synthase [Acidobacteriota bacterium]